MIALIHFCMVQPFFQSRKTSQGSTHRHDLERIGPIENALNRLKLGNDCLEKVASLLVLHQVELIDDEELDIEKGLFFD